jgi:effector-binding domain-containing protein
MSYEIILPTKNKKHMKIKTHPPLTVLYSTHRTTIQQLNQFVGTVMKDLYTEAANSTLVSGPVYWIYHGMDGKPDTEFTLEIALPIQGKFESSKFSIKDLPAFKTVTHVHEGAWEQLHATYGQMMQHIEANKIPMKDECRELYLNIDFQKPENNITEVQVGIL